MPNDAANVFGFSIAGSLKVNYFFSTDFLLAIHACLVTI